MNHLIWIVLDSCRWDSYDVVNTPNIDKYVGRVEPRYTYDSWTYPAHLNFLAGLVPHKNLPYQFASRQYKEEMKKWGERLDCDELRASSFLPRFSLVPALKELGYFTKGIVSLPCLNHKTLVAQDFDEWEMMNRCDLVWDITGMMEFDISYFKQGMYRFSPWDSRASSHLFFLFINIGNTHYPYGLRDLPYISGLHGTLEEEKKQQGGKEWFEEEDFQRMHRAQCDQVRVIDEALGAIFGACPENTYFIVCADHGELFGESNYFGHGPIFHEALFKVPFVEGRIRK